MPLWKDTDMVRGHKPTIDEYLEHKRMGSAGTGRRGSEKTLATYRTQMNLAERLLGKPLADFTEGDAHQLKVLMEDHELSVSTKNLTITVLRGFFKWAIAQSGLITAMQSNAFDQISTEPQRQKADILTIDEATFIRLMDTMEAQEDARRQEILDEDSNTKNYGWVQARFAEKYRLVLSIMFYGGARITEARELLKKNVFDDGVIVIGKGDKERFLPLPPKLLAELKAYVDTHKWGPFVFYGETGRAFLKGSEPLDEKRLYECFREASNALGLPQDFTPHNLRHSFGTEALKKTQRIEVVQDLLGHANPATTRLYAKVLRDDLKSQYAKIYS
jgi:site-specific recombinase XerD